MRILVLTIIGTLFCFVSGNCQQRRGGFDCYFGVPPGVNLDNLGEKKKFPIDYCAIANFGEDSQLQLEMPISKTNEKKPCIKITDFGNIKKNRSAIGPIIAWQRYNQAKYHACSTRLATLQASALAAYRQKFYGKHKPVPARVSIPNPVQPTSL